MTVIPRQRDQSTTAKHRRWVLLLVGGDAVLRSRGDFPRRTVRVRCSARLLGEHTRRGARDGLHRALRSNRPATRAALAAGWRPKLASIPPWAVELYLRIMGICAHAYWRYRGAGTRPAPSAGGPLRAPAGRAPAWASRTSAARDGARAAGTGARADRRYARKGTPASLALTVMQHAPPRPDRGRAVLSARPAPPGHRPGRRICAFGPLGRRRGDRREAPTPINGR